MGVSRTKKRWSPWPIGIVVFFLTIVAVNVLMLTLAFRGYGGTLDHNPYEAGIGYQDEIDALTAFSRELLPAQIQIVPVQVVLRSLDGSPFIGASVRIHAIRPDDPSQDVDSELKENAPGVYGSSRVVKPGKFLARVFISRNGTRYQYNATVGPNVP